MVLMRSLCKGSSTSLLPKSDVITLTALLKAAKAPAGCTIAESGMSCWILHCTEFVIRGVCYTRRSVCCNDVPHFSFQNLSGARFGQIYILRSGTGPDLGENDCTYLIIGFLQSQVKQHNVSLMYANGISELFHSCNVIMLVKSAAVGRSNLTGILFWSDSRLSQVFNGERFRIAVACLQIRCHSWCGNSHVKALKE